jgi:hypothetical protein
MRNVPGRKTDVQDCVWIAQWLEHGRLRGSFVPPAPIRELRDLTRYRKGLIQERVRERQRLQAGVGGLRAALIEAALGAMRVQDGRLVARYRCIMRHRGHKKAVVAGAHTILVIIYHMRKRQVPSQEVGAASLDQRDRDQATRRHVTQVERLGHRVIREPAA